MDKKSWLLFIVCTICFSSYDPFADVKLWDIYEATPESSLNDLTDNEIEIDQVQCYKEISPKTELLVFLFLKNL